MPENKDDLNLGGWTLHRAAVENTAEIAQALIARGDEVDVRDDTGWTPLHWAAGHNSLDVVRLLIEYGSEFNARDDREWTPLHWAAAHNSLARHAS